MGKKQYIRESLCDRSREDRASLSCFIDHSTN